MSDTATQAINAALNVAKFGLDSWDCPKPNRLFGIGPDGIGFIGRNSYNTIEFCIDIVHKKDKALYNTITRKTVESEILTLLAFLNSEERQCNDQDVKLLFKRQLDKPIEEFEVLNLIFGINTMANEIKCGDFAIFTLEDNNNILKNKYTQLEKYSDLYFEGKNEKYFIGVKVKVRELHKAYEVANSLFISFESVMHFIIQDVNHIYRPGIFNYVGNRNMLAIAVNEKTSGQSATALDTALPITFHANKTEPNQDNHLFKLITKLNKTDIKKRLLQAIEWIGKAIHEKDLPKALVQYMFALEGLLKVTEDSFLTASILSQISEWIALLIGNDFNDRKYYIKTFKD